MPREFDKKLMFDNIAYLLKETGKKIGEVENEAGVSAGYISRTSKDQNAKPGIDFIVRIADALHVGIDTLLGIDLSSLTPTERYLLTFLEKLRDDTAADKLEWHRESADSLNRMETDINGNVDHPLFSYETFYEEGEGDYPDQVSRVVFLSHTFDCHTFIDQECFNLRLKNGAYVYLMHVEKSVHRTNDPDVRAIEVWMVSPGECQYLCSSLDGSPLAPLVTALYAIVQEFSKHPKIKGDFKRSIDAFLNDDLDDDPVPQTDDLPF